MGPHGGGGSRKKVIIEEGMKNKKWEGGGGGGGLRPTVTWRTRPEPYARGYRNTLVVEPPLMPNPYIYIYISMNIFYEHFLSHCFFILC
jgi:hypothetical protein